MSNVIEAQFGDPPEQKLYQALMNAIYDNMDGLSYASVVGIIDLAHRQIVDEWTS